MTSADNIRRMAGGLDIHGHIAEAEAMRLLADVVEAATLVTSRDDWRNNVKGYPMLRTSLARVEALQL